MKLFYLILILILSSCSLKKGNRKLVKSSCHKLKIRQSIKITPEGKGIVELSGYSNCKNKELYDKSGRKWKIDLSGKVVIPQKIDETILLSPSKDTISYDSILASRLFTSGYYYLALKSMFGILSFNNFLNEMIIRKYFCDKWKFLKKSGANWEKLQNQMVAISRIKNNKTELINIFHGFSLLFPKSERIKTVPVRRINTYPITMVKLMSMNSSEQSGEFIVVSTESNSKLDFESLLKLKSLKWKNLNDEIQRGQIGGKIYLKRIINIKKLYVLVLYIGKKEMKMKQFNNIIKSFKLFPFTEPCAESGK